MKKNQTSAGSASNADDAGAQPASSTTQALTRGEQIATALMLLFVVVSHFGWALTEFVDDLDVSWAAALTWFWQNDVQFGPDFIFTYGPYGFLVNGFVPLSPLRITLVTLLSLVFAAVLLRFFTRVLGSVKGAIGCFALFWLLTSGDPTSPLMLLSPALLVWFVRWDDNATFLDSRFDRALLHAAMIALALVGLIKATFAIEAVITVAAVGLRYIQLRKIPTVWLTYVVALLAWWIAAGQSLLNIPLYVRRSLEITTGYDAMMTPLLLPMSQAYVVLAWGLAIFAAVVVIAWSRWRFWSIVIALVTLAYLFLLFKHGLVRHDQHVLVTSWRYLTLTTAVVICGFCFYPRVPARAVFASLLLAALVVHSMLVMQCSGSKQQAAFLASTWQDRLTGVFQNANSALQYAVGAAGTEQIWQKQLQAVREQTPLPPVEGTIDVMSSEHQVLAMAYGWDYVSRPVLQSYSAYTPALQRANLDFLLSDRAPDNLLFISRPIDGRLPSLDDAPSWQAMMRRYRPAGIYPYTASDRPTSMLMLRKAQTERDINLTPIGTHTLRWGEVLELPKLDRGSILWAKVRMPVTPAGGVMRTLYRTPMLVIDQRQRGGRTQRYRYIPPMGEEGFVLAPLVVDANDFLHLGWGKADSAFWDYRAIDAVSWRVLIPSTQQWVYEETFTVELFEMRVERGGGVSSTSR